jgi:hypothetical protein
LNAKIGEYLTKLREGQPVSQQELTALQQTVERVKERGLLLTNEKGIYGEVAKQLAFVADKQSEINEKKKASPDPEIVQAAAEHLNYQNQIADRGEDENQAAASAADNRERAKGIIDSILGPQQAVKEETGATADEAERGGEATLQIGQNAVSIIPQINQTTQAMAQLKAEAQAAAAAVASASGGGGSVVQNPFAQYHGGPTYLANGGFARGQDRIAAALAPGETVINRKQSGRFFSELNAMNQGSTPVYREQGGPVTNVGDVNVSVQGGDSSQQTVREIGHALRREIQRGNIKLR